MAILLLAEHDNKTLSDQTAKALAAAAKIGDDMHILVAGKGCRAVAEQAAKLSGVAKVRLADSAEYEHLLAEPVAEPDRQARRRLRHDRRAGDDFGQEYHAARRRTPRRNADFRSHRGQKRRHLRAADLCRQRHPDGAIDRRQAGHHRPHRRFPGGRRRRFGTDRDGRRGRRSRTVEIPFEPPCRRPTGRN